MDKDIDLMIAEEIDLSNEAYYAFTDKIITISTGALTLLIIFRNSLVGDQSVISLWLVKVTWLGFMTAILTGTIWALSKYRVHRDMALKLKEYRNGGAWEFVKPRWYYNLARRMMICTFLCAIMALTLFGILNIQ